MRFVSKVKSNTAYTATDLRHLHHSLIKCLSTGINKQYKNLKYVRIVPFNLVHMLQAVKHMNDATVLEISMDIHEPEHIHQPTTAATLLTHTKQFYTQQSWTFTGRFNNILKSKVKHQTGAFHAKKRPSEGNEIKLPDMQAKAKDKPVV